MRVVLSDKNMASELAGVTFIIAQIQQLFGRIGAAAQERGSFDPQLLAIDCATHRSLPESLKTSGFFSLHCSYFLVTYRHFALVFSLLCLRVFVLVFSRFPFLCVFFILKFSEVRFRPRKGDSIHCACLFLILLPHAL